MKRYLGMTWAYRIASALILIGFAALCQPFAHWLFAIGFPVLLAGVVLFMILDHIPERQGKEED